ncbi:MAG: aminotransferase class III-fold pyridoxal phosphate-dependent enzyme, partial [Pseudomonadota bacterium]
MAPASSRLPESLEGFDNVWFPYGQLKSSGRPPVAMSTEGVRIHLDDGRTLIDGVGSWWTAVHGYNHPTLLAAVQRQLEAMPHVMLGGIVHEPVLRLAERLARMTPGALTKTFFSESGSVAVEVAMKIAVQYWRNKFDQKRTKFISFTGGYHGDTFATMSICDPDKGLHSLFKGSLAEQHVVDLPYDNAQAEKIADLAT